MDPIQQQEKLWSEMLEKNNATTSADGRVAQQASPTAIDTLRRTWPTYDEVLSHLSEADYTGTLTCPHDTLLPTKSISNCPMALAPTKTLCPHGVVCCAEMEIFAGGPYTGLLQGGTKAACILRLSSAMKPPSVGVKSALGRTLLYCATGEKIRKARLFPCAAVKVFRHNIYDNKDDNINNNNSTPLPSGNLLFGGSKVGQREADFFAHCLCTSMTEQMPRLVKPLVRKFWTYSDYPLSLGVSDFCRTNASGEQVDNERIRFPFAVVLRPCIQHGDEDVTTTEQQGGCFEDSFDGFLDRTLSVSAGTVLFDIFACPEPCDVPDAAKLQRIGRITTTSEMIQSSATDGLFFRHQKKEEDYALRPGWSEALQAPVTMNDGQTAGTIGKLAGWKLFEQHIAERRYVDYEEKLNVHDDDDDSCKCRTDIM